MANDLFNSLMGSKSSHTQTQQMSGIPSVNPNGNIFEEWNKFKNSFQGNPETIGKQMVNNGMISQQQFNMLSAMANMYRGTLK